VKKTSEKMAEKPLRISEVVKRIEWASGEPISQKTVLYWIKQGRIPAKKPFGRWLVWPSALEVFLTENFSCN
jgi:hypothetical protein